LPRARGEDGLAMALRGPLSGFLRAWEGDGLMHPEKAFRGPVGALIGIASVPLARSRRGLGGGHIRHGGFGAEAEPDDERVPVR
jgi:hypothetical protein